MGETIIRNTLCATAGAIVLTFGAVTSASAQRAPGLGVIALPRAYSAEQCIARVRIWLQQSQLMGAKVAINNVAGYSMDVERQISQYVRCDTPGYVLITSAGNVDVSYEHNRLIAMFRTP